MMESLQGLINPILVGEEMKTECMEPGPVSSCSSGLDVSYETLLPYYQMPFLQLLQGAMGAGDEAEEENQLVQLYLQQQQQQQQNRTEEHDCRALFTPRCPQQSNVELLLRLQSQQQHQNNKWPVTTTAMEQLESCVTHVSEPGARRPSGPYHQSPKASSATGGCSTAVGPRPERKKRKRSRSAAAPSKSTEETESQRMAHINVERNRRRLMNDHLSVLRSLMPPSSIQRGDQASIIGGAIDFIKELEHKLLSLQVEKRLRASATVAATSSDASSGCTKARDGRDEEDGASLDAAAAAPVHGSFFISPQYTSYTESLLHRASRCGISDVLGREVDPDILILGVDVEATVVQGHVNLKVAGQRRAGQLVAAVAAMEELRLSVLHLNITSLGRASVLYSFNLKMEDGCKLGSAEEIATAVHQIFSYINACSNSCIC